MVFRLDPGDDDDLALVELDMVFIAECMHPGDDDDFARAELDLAFIALNPGVVIVTREHMFNS